MPTVKLELDTLSPPVLKKNETIHFAEFTALHERKIVTVGYQQGYRGTSFRLMKGVSIRTKGQRGYAIKEERLVPISQGVLILTNQRIFLHPLPGQKTANVPFPKLLAYNYFNDGVEIHKEGRQKSFFFALKEGSPETVALCLEFLTREGV
ncbi:hypothetical protein JXM67_01500 [candidate division WOR-3 bacterium]|nr:hypothetical protein [candidate division WOR-3 bacterium]